MRNHSISFVLESCWYADVPKAIVSASALNDDRLCVAKRVNVCAHLD